jgi:hypothetical protein
MKFDREGLAMNRNDLFFNLDAPENFVVKVAVEKSGDTINEFSNLFIDFINALEKKSKFNLENLTDDVILFFIRKIIESLNSIALLMKNSCTDQANILIRSLYEVCLQLAFILQADSEMRAAIYYVSEVYSVDECGKLFEPLESFYNNKSFMQLLKMDPKITPYTESHKSLMKIIDGNPTLNKADQLRTERINLLKQKNKNPHPKWYNICDNSVNSLSCLSKSVGWNGVHNLEYHILSIEAHGFKIINKLGQANGNSEMLKINFPYNAKAVIEETQGYCIQIMQRLKKYYFPDDKEIENEFNMIYFIGKTKLATDLIDQAIQYK